MYLHNFNLQLLSIELYCPVGTTRNAKVHSFIEINKSYSFYCSKQAEQNCTEKGNPKYVFQQRKGNLENDSDNKAQYQKTCNDRDGSYDLWRYNLRDKPNGTDNDRKQDSEFDEACPTEVADLLGRSRLLFDIIGFVRCVCLDEGRCVNVLIHDDCIHNRGF